MPDQWPEVTKEAIKAGAKGGQSEEFLKGLITQGRDEKGQPRQMPAMWMDMIRRMVIQQLKAWSDIKYPADGIGPDIVVDVNGMKWKTADAFNEI